MIGIEIVFSLINIKNERKDQGHKKNHIPWKSNVWYYVF